MATCPLQCQQDIRIQPDDFDLKHEMAKITACGKNIGAVVTFTDICRDDEGRLAALEIEHYPGMAQSEIMRAALAASRHWQLTALTLIHRHGYIKAGEQIVLVMTAARHRQPAFEAASFLMDFLKTDAPFWKKEHLADNTLSNWVKAYGHDRKQRRNWRVSCPD